MAILDQLPVYKTSYDLLIDIYSFGKNLQREYKYTLGERLKNETFELVVEIFRANRTEDKIKHLAKAREHIELIRMVVRLLNDIKQINLERFVSLNSKIESISRQLTGWQHKYEK